MFNIFVKFNGSYDNKLSVWVVVYGSKGYHNYVPVSVWDLLYADTNDGVSFNVPIEVSDATMPQNPITKHAFDAALAQMSFFKSTFYGQDSFFCRFY